MDDDELKEIDTLILKMQVAEEKRKFDIHLAYIAIIMSAMLDCIEHLKKGYRLSRRERTMILLILGHFLKFDGAPATLNHICDTLGACKGIQQLEAPIDDITNNTT